MAIGFRVRATILLAELNFRVSQGKGPAGSEINAPAVVIVSEWVVYSCILSIWSMNGH